jgi:hypothetical protein
MVQATLLLADKAVKHGATRLTLLSGVSYPIVSDQRLLELANSEFDYVDTGEADLNQISKAFYRRFICNHFSFPLKQNIFGRAIRRLSRELWALMPKLDPIQALSPTQLMIGSQRWSVKRDTYLQGVELLKSNRSFDTYFKKIECSDESYFATIFSAVSDNIKRHGTTYVKWVGRGKIQDLDCELIRELRGTQISSLQEN